MLETNSGCDLPCWWGVAPGQSEWQTVTNLIATLGFGIQMPHPDRLFDYTVNLDFSEKDGLVDSIQVHSEVFRGATSERFAQDWQRYSPDQLLSKYGVPSQVYIHMMPPIERDAPVYYTLWLVYDQVGFFIIYRGPASYEPPTMQACPQFKEVTWIVLYLESPGLSQLFTDPSTNPPVTLEEATGMDMVMFYETFKNPDSDTCIESPANIWP
ncbi:MAG: hypothetical protein GY832_00945 [Chloroflexi bacterium]|nr:hypothetical protein [Chloroflexota bacterium]